MTKKKITRSKACLAGLMLVMGSAGMTSQSLADMEGAEIGETDICALKINFQESDAVNRWQIVNDGVMGGRSQGTRYAEDGYMAFQGAINTNGGGFSSLRRSLSPGDLTGASGIRMMLQSDGRQYRLTFRTSERWRGRSVSYQAAIPKTLSGEWQEVMVPFESMQSSVFGRSVRAASFDASDAREIGIILADGVDGPFKLEVKNLSCVVTTPHSS